MKQRLKRYNIARQNALVKPGFFLVEYLHVKTYKRNTFRVGKQCWRAQTQTSGIHKQHVRTYKGNTFRIGTQCWGAQGICQESIHNRQRLAYTHHFVWQAKLGAQRQTSGAMHQQYIDYKMRKGNQRPRTSCSTACRGVICSHGSSSSGGGTTGSRSSYIPGNITLSCAAP
jgi:hypothetical protein